ncbi:MAG: BatA domain-containing protein, partial [bacterium]|nr:BatA domain-containing protein [bacterium]
MTPGLLFPAGLAALAALLVPLAIHIARRSEQVPTDFAALRWLRQKPKPRSRLRFDEWLLLALRLALLVTVALWLAQPVLFGDASDAPYIAVVPGLAPSATVLKDRDVHWLAPGFPAIDKDANTAPAAADIPLASLVRQLDAELPNQRPLTIIVPQIITGADGQRLMLSRKINWHIVPGTMPTGQVVERPAPKLSFRTDPAHAAGLRYLRAAATTWWRADLDADLDGGSTNQPLPGTDRNLIWLADGSLPMAVRQWVERGGTALVAADTVAPDGVTPVPLWQDELGKPLVEAMP